MGLAFYLLNSLAFQLIFVLSEVVVLSLEHVPFRLYVNIVGAVVNVQQDGCLLF